VRPPNNRRAQPAGTLTLYTPVLSRALLTLLNTPEFMYKKGSRVCHRWDELQAALASRGFVRTVAALKDHAAKLREA
jgi:hypothetical protein